MNQPWSQAIARLAKIKNHDASVLDQAQSELRAAHNSIHKQSLQNEKTLKQLEKDYSAAKDVLDELADQMRRTQRHTQPTQSNELKALQSSMIDSQTRVGEIEQSLLELKGVVSHNRYRLFQLSQQLDTLCATSQLHKAHNAQHRNTGVTTALDALAAFSQRQACNDDN